MARIHAVIISFLDLRWCGIRKLVTYRYRAHSLYKSLCGSYSDVGATAKDFQNWMRDVKLYIGKRDADMLIEKFKTKKETTNGGFFYEYETDPNGHLTRIFWADVEGRQSYEVFGEVVSFDATYRTNK